MRCKFLVPTKLLVQRGEDHVVILTVGCRTHVLRYLLPTARPVDRDLACASRLFVGEPRTKR